MLRVCQREEHDRAQHSLPHPAPPPHLRGVHRPLRTPPRRAPRRDARSAPERAETHRGHRQRPRRAQHQEPLHRRGTPGPHQRHAPGRRHPKNPRAVRARPRLLLQRGPVAQRGPGRRDRPHARQQRRRPHRPHQGREQLLPAFLPRLGIHPHPRRQRPQRHRRPPRLLRGAPGHRAGHGAPRRPRLSDHLPDHPRLPRPARRVRVPRPLPRRLEGRPLPTHLRHD